MRLKLYWILASIFFGLAPLAAVAAELVMIEEMGCVWCDRWNEEIAPIYPKTAEGKFASLRRIDIKEIPDDLDIKSTPVFTPTFILIENGKELARLEGYPGPDFFWPLLTEMLKETTDFKETGS